MHWLSLSTFLNPIQRYELLNKLLALRSRSIITPRWSYLFDRGLALGRRLEFGYAASIGVNVVETECIAGIGPCIPLSPFSLGYLLLLWRNGGWLATNDLGWLHTVMRAWLPQMLPNVVEVLGIALQQVLLVLWVVLALRERIYLTGRNGKHVRVDWIILLHPDLGPEVDTVQVNCLGKPMVLVNRQQDDLRFLTLGPRIIQLKRSWCCFFSLFIQHILSNK